MIWDEVVAQYTRSKRGCPIVAEAVKKAVEETGATVLHRVEFFDHGREVAVMFTKDGMPKPRAIRAAIDRDSLNKILEFVRAQ